jgi:hypothetical protein
VIVIAMRDGLYLVTTRTICAAFVIKGGKVVACAPILGKRFEYWKTQAVWICP